ncbi:MAG: non-ribosomal peptide synthetase, partial [bacterium]|nr:non-ribosomal peptide synthetase [bacterium]
RNAETVFNLARPPLLKADLLYISPTQFILFINMHHIVSDGWSSPIFIKELATLYHAFAFRRPDSTEHPEQHIPDLLPALRIQYRDYTHWQHRHLTTDFARKAKEYWHEKLSTDTPLLNFPTDSPRPAARTSNGSLVHHRLDSHLAAGIFRLSKQEGTTLFMALSAAVNVLVCRYTGQTDMILGTPVAGRDHPDMEDQIGFYVNTLALRTTLNPDDGFETLLRRVKQNILGDFEHQTYPFDRLVEELDLDRDHSHHPLFDIMVVMQDNQPLDLRFEELEITPFQVDDFHIHNTGKFDLTFNFTEAGNGKSILMGVEYNTDLFRIDRIQRLCDHFTQLIKSIGATPRQPIKHLDILNENEKHQLLVDFNDTTIDYPGDKTIVELFEEQAGKEPDSIA